MPLGNVVLAIFSIFTSFFKFKPKPSGKPEDANSIMEFVILAAERAETLIPDGGMGSAKLALFDQALKLFIYKMVPDRSPTDAEVLGMWDTAHTLLEDYLAKKKKGKV